MNILSMHLQRLFKILLASVVTYAILGQQILAESIEPIMKDPVWVYETEGTFEDLEQSLKFAIESRSLVISSISHSSEMFQRTAEAVGVDELIYDRAESIFFCSSPLSHAMVKEDPHALMLCPYSIAIYTLRKNPEHVYLSIRPPLAKPASYAAIHELLVSIVSDAINF